MRPPGDKSSCFECGYTSHLGRECPISLAMVKRYDAAEGEGKRAPDERRKELGGRKAEKLDSPGCLLGIQNADGFENAEVAGGGGNNVFFETRGFVHMYRTSGVEMELNVRIGDN